MERQRSANGWLQRFKTLRIWVTNTAENQLWQGGSSGSSGGSGGNVDGFSYATNAEASYRVKIEGRLLDDGEDDEDEDDEDKTGKDGTGDAAVKEETGAADAMEIDQQGKDKKDKKGERQPRYRFTQFFKAMTVEFNSGKKNGGMEAAAAGSQKTVEWKRPERTGHAAGQAATAQAAVAEFDELTFRRPGDENVNITINLFRHEEPERYELDEILADIVDMREATRAEAVMGLFEYIRLLHLQEDEEKRNFRCDEQLRRVGF